MSRVGRAPVAIPNGVSVGHSEGEVNVKGPKGTLSVRLPEGITVENESAPAGETNPSVRSSFLVSRAPKCEDEDEDCQSAQIRLQDYIATLEAADSERFSDHQLVVSALSLQDDQTERDVEEEAFRTFYVYRSSDVASPDPNVALALREGRIDWVTVTSSAIARSLVRLFGDELRRTRLAAISPLTAQVLDEAGYPPVAVADVYTTAGLIEAMVAAEHA